MKKIITIISVFADTLQRIFSVATDVFSIIATVALMLIRTGLSVFAVQVLFDFVHKAQMGASGYVVASIATVVIIVKYVQAFIRAKHAIFVWRCTRTSEGTTQLSEFRRPACKASSGIAAALPRP